MKNLLGYDGQGGHVFEAETSELILYHPPTLARSLLSYISLFPRQTMAAYLPSASVRPHSPRA